MARVTLALCVVIIAASGSIGRVVARQTVPDDIPEIRWFFQTAAQDDDLAQEALDRLAAAWKDSYAAILVDMAWLMQPPRRPPVRRTIDLGIGVDRRPDFEPPPPPEPPSAVSRRRIVRLLEQQTGQRFGDDLTQWREWVWQLPYEPHPDYAAFKGLWYGAIDPPMRDFFPPDVKSLIRLDEVAWGGVRVNGIPPLEYPGHVAAADADYLRDKHLVFGIALNGEARAYPKRILAWHEMALDRLGGVELTVVYCTLCGTVIPYESVVGGEHRKFGTSGLLYRSNKLMFDHETRSLWNTFEGKPVIGRLVGSGLALRPHSVVTTTWGEWRAQHPQTTVLSLDTGHERDYSEGAAYRDYFSTDRLMFSVSLRDNRLKNKDEVVVMQLPTAAADRRQPLAIAAKFLRDRPVYHARVAGHSLVVVTSPEGANRVYDAGPVQFTRQLDRSRIVEDSGRIWRVTEDALVSQDERPRRLPRLPAQRAFWFGWYAQFPNTELIK